MQVNRPERRRDLNFRDARSDLRVKPRRIALGIRRPVKIALHVATLGGRRNLEIRFRRQS